MICLYTELAQIDISPLGLLHVIVTSLAMFIPTLDTRHMVPTAKEILFSRTNYTQFKGNKSRYVLKAYHIYSLYDRLLIFMLQPPPHPLQLSDPPTFI